LTAQAGEPPLAGLRTVVTGASSGIGRAIAIAFAAAGARVGIGFCRSAEAAEALASELDRGRAVGREGGHPLLRADLGTLAGCTAIVRDAFAALEDVDVWVNNAGADVLTGEARSWSDERKLELLIDVDLKATIRCSRLVAGRMRPGGCIINIGWDHATIDGMAGDNPELFAAVKGGVLGFSKSFARSVAPDVRVNVLCPGWVETAYGAGTDRAFYEKVANATPLRRWGQPEDIAGAAVWLASPAAAFITGQAINVNGGTVG
jgi:3-oxoacyl-[acyl-carrier protein] reductase